MAHHAHSDHLVTLESVREQFIAWRSSPHRRRRIPEELWIAAVELCGDHSICKVSRTLRLDYKTLRSRCRNPARDRLGASFVEVGSFWPQPEVLVECNDGKQHHLRIHCRGPMDRGVVDLVKGFFEHRR
jgi:hypothetical protein